MWYAAYGSMAVEGALWKLTSFMCMYVQNLLWGEITGLRLSTLTCYLFTNFSRHMRSTYITVVDNILTATPRS